MLSPGMSLGELGGSVPLLSPGDPLLSSPLNFSLPSPATGLGRTPGAHVVQEGRLSLEMFGLVAPGELGGSTGPGSGIEMLAQLNAHVSGRGGGTGLPKGSSIPQLNPSTTNQQPKLTPPALATATAEQMTAKDAYAAKLRQLIPENVTSQAAQIIANSKIVLGFPGIDSARLEARLTAILAGTDPGCTALPPLPSITFEPAAHPAQPTTTDAHPPPPPPPQRTSRRIATKRIRDPEADIDPSTLPPPKRVARMEALYTQLRAIHDQNVALDTSMRDAQAHLAKIQEENDNLWGATAHIGAAMHAAIEERDSSHSGGGGGNSSSLSFGNIWATEQKQTRHNHHHHHDHLQHQNEQQEQQPGVGPHMVPVMPPPSTGGIGIGVGGIFTPGTGGLASLFGGEDLFAALDMFVNHPTERLFATGGGGEGEEPQKQQQQQREKQEQQQRPTMLFADEVVVAVVHDNKGQGCYENDVTPTGMVDEAPFSFRL